MTTLTTTTTATTTSSVSKGKKPYKSWLKDGVNGGMSSMDILINWLANKANYSKWRGGDNNAERTPKKVLLEEIIEQMRQVGIYHRLPKDVASKISTLQSNYRTAREWNDTEGKKLRQAGVKDDIVHGNNNKKKRKKNYFLCNFFFIYYLKSVYLYKICVGERGRGEKLVKQHNICICIFTYKEYNTSDIQFKNTFRDTLFLSFFFSWFFYYP